MDVLMGSFPKFSLKLFFEMLMDGCSKNSSNIFSRTRLDTSEWMKKKIKEKCLDNLVDFQMAFKMCRKTIIIMLKEKAKTKAKRNDRFLSKQN